MLFHRCCPNDDPGGGVGWHAFTPVAGDYSKWSLSLEAAYSLNVSWVNGTQGGVMRRERPQIYFDPTTGVPQVLFNGVVVGADSSSFTMAARISAGAE